MAEYIKKDAIIDIFNAKADMSIGTPKAIFFAAAKMIEKFPTADVAEVRHGKNVTQINPVDEFICSDCGFRCGDYSEIIYVEDGDYEYSRECVFNYCPNCGAKMDLGDGEE